MIIWCFYAAGQPDDPPSPGIGRARHSSKSSPTGSAQTELLLFSPGINIVIIITIIISMINQDRRPATDHRGSLTSSPTLPPAKPSASTFQAAQIFDFEILMSRQIDLGFPPIVNSPEEGFLQRVQLGSSCFQGPGDRLAAF